MSTQMHVSTQSMDHDQNFDATDALSWYTILSIFKRRQSK